MGIVETSQPQSSSHGQLLPGQTHQATWQPPPSLHITLSSHRAMGITEAFLEDDGAILGGNPHPRQRAGCRALLFLPARQLGAGKERLFLGALFPPEHTVQGIMLPWVCPCAAAQGGCWCLPRSFHLGDVRRGRHLPGNAGCISVLSSCAHSSDVTVSTSLTCG